MVSKVNDKVNIIILSIELKPVHVVVRKDTLRQSRSTQQLHKAWQLYTMSPKIANLVSFRSVPLYSDRKLHVLVIMTSQLINIECIALA
jgi:hypothetical protein